MDTKKKSDSQVKKKNLEAGHDGDACAVDEEEEEVVQAEVKGEEGGKGYWGTRAAVVTGAVTCVWRGDLVLGGAVLVESVV